jgi:hypothetical protein
VEAFTRNPFEVARSLPVAAVASMTAATSPTNPKPVRIRGPAAFEYRDVVHTAMSLRPCVVARHRRSSIRRRRALSASLLLAIPNSQARAGPSPGRQRPLASKAAANASAMSLGGLLGGAGAFPPVRHFRISLLRLFGSD